MMQRRGRGRALFFIPIALFVFCVAAAAVMLLWNAVMPPLINAKNIDYRQALGLLALCRILFGRFSGAWRGSRGRPHWRQKWQGMNEEERARFKEEWRQRCEAKRG